MHIWYSSASRFSLLPIASWAVVAVVGAAVFILVLITILSIKNKEKTASETMVPEGLGSSEIRVLLTLTNDAVVVTDRSLKVINYNANFRDLLGASIIMNNQELGSLLKITDVSGNFIETRSLPNFNKTDTLKYDSLFILDQANQRLEIELQLIRMHSKIANHVVYIWKLSNISTRKQLEREQSEFISVISHELRTPVAVIEASTAALLEDRTEDLSPQQHKFIDASRENALLLSKLLGDLSVYTKLQQGDISLEHDTISPYTLLEQIKRVFSSQAESKKIALIVDHSEETRSVRSSEAHILSILQNFVSNAIQFTQPGGVVIIGGKSVEDGVVFIVRDSGIGIEPAVKEKLFDTTFHAHTDTKHTTLKGAGLGLYISARLAKALGASIWVESEEGKGSTFYLKVPKKATKPAE